MEYKVISTDNHITEGPNTFINHIAAEYKDRAPRIMRGPDGGDGWSFDGKPPRNTFGLNAVAGRPFEDYKVSGLKLEEILPGNYDGVAHLADMDLDGVDAATIFPLASLAAYNQEDRGFGVALMRAYNDWLMDEFCAADPKRLIPLPLVPVDDPMDVLLAELDRVVAKGATAVFVPYFTAQPYYSKYYDPFWKAITDHDVAVAIHRTMGGNAPANQMTPGTDEAEGINLSGIVERFFTAIQPFGRMVFSGLFERFPTLRFVDAEVNVGWLPFWVQMMEQEYERQRHWANPPLHTNPREFVGKNLFVTFLDDYVGTELVKRDPMTASAAMFSTDYPHSTTLFPHTQKIIGEMTEGMDEHTKHAILAGNAQKVFRIG